MNHPLICISGPSGSGKTTIVNRLVESGAFLEAVSTTTRQPRQGEIEGVAYYFRSSGFFQSIVEAEGFYENIRFNGNSYGIEKKELNEKTSKKPTLIVVEPDGVLHLLSKYFLGALYSVYLNVDFDTCVGRMKERGDSEDAVRNRSAYDKDYFPKAFSKVRWDISLANYDIDKTCKVIASLAQ